jgi:hypothetical protein
MKPEDDAVGMLHGPAGNGDSSFKRLMAATGRHDPNTVPAA